MPDKPAETAQSAQTTSGGSGSTAATTSSQTPDKTEQAQKSGGSSEQSGKSSKSGTAVSRAADARKQAEDAKAKANEEAIEAQAQVTEDWQEEYNKSGQADVAESTAEAERLMRLPSPEANRILEERSRPPGVYSSGTSGITGGPSTVEIEGTEPEEGSQVPTERPTS